MKKILKLFEEEFNKNSNNIYYQAIPPLTDRIRILEHKKQIYGTNWFAFHKDKPFLISVEDFPNMNQRRAVYGLDPAKRPVNLAKGADKYPLGKGLAVASDQKDLSQAGYSQYSRFNLKRIT